jgi:hypothetical protein
MRALQSQSYHRGRKRRAGLTITAKRSLLSAAALALAMVSSDAARAAAPSSSIPVIPVTASTVPKSPVPRDTNPYGVAFVPTSSAWKKAGAVARPGDVLVSNFNDSSNEMGQGSTIVDISPTGATTTFFASPTASITGLDNGLVALANGFVLVSFVPVTYSPTTQVGQGGIAIINPDGSLNGFVADPTLLNEPWSMTVGDESNSKATLFVSNLGGGGSVTRVELAFTKSGVTLNKGKGRVLATGFTSKGTASDITHNSFGGPGGLAFDSTTRTLFVASEFDNAIFKIRSALRTNSTVQNPLVAYADPIHLHNPMGLVLAPNGHLIAANADLVNVDPDQPSELVEFTVAGDFFAQYSVDTNSGGAFGLAVAQPTAQVKLGAVDDNQNNLTIH